jgi:hypothetical protein
MDHITDTAQIFPFLYYQRIFVKGYLAFAVPAVMPVRSALVDGYIYIRRRTRGLRIRDLENAFTRDDSHGPPTGVINNPVRNIEAKNCISAQVNIWGRDEPFTWLYSRDDLPRIVNDETFTEFLACVPVRHSSGAPVGDLNIITTYYASFIDWYRIVTGDISMVGPDHWNSHIPMYGECLVDIRGTGDKKIDEVVLDVDPTSFSPIMFHADVEPNEKGSVNKPVGGISNEERIAHYLRRGLAVPLVHKRLADILHLAQETRDWALVALSMFPVFEQYFDEFMLTVGSRYPAFQNFMDERTPKSGIVFFGKRIGWMNEALTQLGYSASSVKQYIDDLSVANEERVQVVHYAKTPSFEDSMLLARRLSNAVFLCETVLGNDSPYVVVIEKIR